MILFSRLRLIVIVICAVPIILVLKGCAAGAILGEVELLGMGTRAVFSQAARVAATSSTMGATELFTTGFLLNGAGNIAVQNQVAANTLLSRFTMRYTRGESPRIYDRETNQPMMEVFTKSNRIHILGTDKVFPIPENMFMVDAEGSVNVRSGVLSNSKVVAKVYKGDLVIKLATHEEWYQIQLIRQGRPIIGFIKVQYLMPVAYMLGSENEPSPSSFQYLIEPKRKEHNCAEELTGNYTFLNKTGQQIIVRLYSSDIPVQYIGNPGLNSLVMTLSVDQTQSFYNLRSGVYNYRITDDARRGESPTKNIEYSGQIKVETCKSLSFDIR